MIVEEILKFSRDVLSKETDEETKILMMHEFLQSKGFGGADSLQLLKDHLETVTKSFELCLSLSRQA